jgi:hypothetical protein
MLFLRICNGNSALALGSITRGPRSVINLLPLLLVGASIYCYVGYNSVLDTSITEIMNGQTSALRISRSGILKSWGSDMSIPHSGYLQLLYLGIFLFMESAFVLMAIREYIIDVRQISEKEWMFGKQDNQGKTNPADDMVAKAVVGSR